MEHWVEALAHHGATLIELIAVIAILVGVLEAVIGAFRVMVVRRAPASARQAVWLDFARWLVVGLTLQLAADIVRTTIAPTWDDLGRLAAVALIRTFLSYFLDRDMEAREPHETHAKPEA